jgi:hypothetical protein
MTRELPMWALTALTLTFASSAHAGTITPDLVVVPVSPAFGAVAAGGRVTDQFKAFGVFFSDGGRPRSSMTRPLPSAASTSPGPWTS